MTFPEGQQYKHVEIKEKCGFKQKFYILLCFLQTVTPGQEIKPKTSNNYELTNENNVFYDA